jgi:hypothetical protein
MLSDLRTRPGSTAATNSIATASCKPHGDCYVDPPERHEAAVSTLAAPRPGRIPRLSSGWHAWACLQPLCASNPARAQADASAALVEQGNYWQTHGPRGPRGRELAQAAAGRPATRPMLCMAWRRSSCRAAMPMRRAEWIGGLRAAHPNDSRLARFQQQAQQAGQASTLQRARAAARAGRGAEAVELYRSQFDNRPPPEAAGGGVLPGTGSTPQGGTKARKGSSSW